MCATPAETSASASPAQQDGSSTLFMANAARDLDQLSRPTAVGLTSVWQYRTPLAPTRRVWSLAESGQ